jgi:cysteine synthase A
MDAAAEKFVHDAIADPEQPLVVFSLEWCEFCWSVKKFLKQASIDFKTVDLDSVPFQEGNLGRSIRDALEQRTSMQTIPQVFIGGEFIGGCTDVFDGWKAGVIQSALKKNGVSYDAVFSKDPYSFLPEWLHPR